MASSIVDTLVCIEYWQQNGQHCQQLALICHFLSQPGHDQRSQQIQSSRDFITFSFKLIWNNIKQCQWECSSKVSQQTPQTVATLCGVRKGYNLSHIISLGCFSTDKMHWFREQIESNLIVGWDVLVDECWLILISFDVMLFLNVSVWVVEIELKQQEQDKYIPMNWNVS